MEYAGPIKIVARMPLPAENVEKFIALAAELVEKSQAEEGNIHYSLNVDSKDPCLLVYTEIWKDEEAIRIHNASEHFTRLVPQLRAMCNGAPSKEVYTELKCK